MPVRHRQKSFCFFGIVLERRRQAMGFYLADSFIATDTLQTHCDKRHFFVQRFLHQYLDLPKVRHFICKGWLNISADFWFCTIFKKLHFCHSVRIFRRVQEYSNRNFFLQLLFSGRQVLFYFKSLKWKVEDSFLLPTDQFHEIFSFQVGKWNGDFDSSRGKSPSFL